MSDLNNDQPLTGTPQTANTPNIIVDNSPVRQSPNPQFAGPSYNAAPQMQYNPGNPHYDYELLRQQEEKKKKICKKVKKRYSNANLIVFLEALVTTFMTIALLVIFFGSTSLSGSSHSRIDRALDKLNTMEEYSVPLTAVVIIPTSIILFLIFKKKNDLGKLSNWFPKTNNRPMVGFLSIMSVAGFGALINLYSCGVIMVSDKDPDSAAAFPYLYSISDSDLPVILMIIGMLYICIVGPIMEELVFRGVVLNLCSHISRTFAVFMSALLFSLMHLNPGQLIPTFVIGMLFAYAALKTHSLMPSIIGHIVYNSQTMVFDIIKYNSYSSEDLTVPAIYLIIVGLVGIVSVIILFAWNKKINESTDGMMCNPYFTNEDLQDLRVIRRSELTNKLFFKCWAFWGIIVLYGVNIILAVILAGSVLLG